MASGNRKMFCKKKVYMVCPYQYKSLLRKFRQILQIYDFNQQNHQRQVMFNNLHVYAYMMHTS